jgi:SAM-dependent methyltransferase
MKIPAPGAQALPRSVRLAPEGDLLPAGFIRKLLQRGTPLELIYQGYALEPHLNHDESFRVDPALPLRPGALALCESDGVPDVRRLLRKNGGQWLTALDPLPAGREWLPETAVLGALAGPRAHGPRIVRVFPFYSRLAALRLWERRNRLALQPAVVLPRSVEEKYEGQVGFFAGDVQTPLTPFLRAVVRAGAAPPASLLIAGCGAGNEAIGLAREGYAVAAFDLLPEMIAAGARAAGDAGVAAEFFAADLTTLALPGRRFDAALLTSLLYGFIPGRAARIEGLRRLGRHLNPGGRVIISVKFMRGIAARLRHALVWIGRRSHGEAGAEFGDWHTWYLAPDGRVATSFTRRFTPRQFRAEVRAAGFRILRDATEGHFILEAIRKP